MANGDGGDFFKGFLFGGIVGAAFSLLYAPKSGKEMREEIRQRSLEMKGEADDKLEVAQKRLEALLEESRKQIDALRKEAEAAAKELKTAAAGKIDEGKAYVASEKGRIKDAIDAGVSAYKEEKTAKSSKS